MKEEESKFDKKRATITSVTTLILLVLPVVEFPEAFLFIVPVAIEFVVVGGLFVWAGYQVGRINKKKNAASESVRRSIESDIKTLEVQMEQATSPKLVKLLEKRLTELYEEQLDESAAHRKGLREDIKKFGDNASLLKAEKESMQIQIAQKFDEELKKAGDSLSKPSQA